MQNRKISLVFSSLLAKYLAESPYKTLKRKRTGHHNRFFLERKEVFKPFFSAFANM